MKKALMTREGGIFGGLPPEEVKLIEQFGLRSVRSMLKKALNGEQTRCFQYINDDLCIVWTCHLIRPVVKSL